MGIPELRHRCFERLDFLTDCCLRQVGKSRKQMVCWCFVEKSRLPSDLECVVFRWSIFALYHGPMVYRPDCKWIFYISHAPSRNIQVLTIKLGSLRLPWLY